MMTNNPTITTTMATKVTESSKEFNSVHLGVRMTDNPGKKQNPGFDDETERQRKEQQSINEPSVEQSNTDDDQLRKPAQGTHDVEIDEEQPEDQRNAS